MRQYLLRTNDLTEGAEWTNDGIFGEKEIVEAVRAFKDACPEGKVHVSALLPRSMCPVELHEMDTLSGKSAFRDQWGNFFFTA